MIEPDGREVVDGLAFHRSPGHSYAHTSISLVSNGVHALFGGDVLHTPVQVYCPEWNSVFCVSADPARVSRYWALNHVADHDALYFSTHFAAPSAGRITRRGDGYAWQYEQPGERS
jgi:glyoxylase-like metal-dependent hydrolase (beta-lactamase superfamily II)